MMAEVWAFVAGIAVGVTFAALAVIAFLAYVLSDV